MAIGVVIIAFSYYGRAREVDAAAPEDDPWVLLFATWRDSMIVTLLFTAQSFAYRYGDFHGLSEVQAQSIYTFAPVITPVMVLIGDVLIFTVAALRVIAISRWLTRRARS